MIKLLIAAILLVQISQKGVNCDIANFLQTVSNWEDVENQFNTVFPHPGGHGEQEESMEKFKGDLVRFYLYTDITTRLRPEEIFIDDYQGLVASRFNKAYPTKFFIHGFGHNYNCSFPQDIKDVYILNGYRVNLIAVDWGALAMDASSFDPVISLRNYHIAVDNIPIVGRRVGKMINYLNQARATTLNKVHIVGFSLGAHVSGLAGEHVYRSWLDRIFRITGLDPAGPLFQTGEIGRPLTDNDAKFVDIIHTDMGQMGTSKSDGHANFFVNSGRPPQPGCVESALRAGFVEMMPRVLSGTCSHNMAPVYYAMSILHTSPFMEAKRCFGYISYETGLCFLRGSVTFGEFCMPGTEGDFYLDLEPMQFSRSYTC